MKRFTLQPVCITFDIPLWRMKALAVSISLLIFALSFSPCADAFYIDKEGETAHVEKNHAQDVQDECPAICSCSCCGVQLVLQPSIAVSSTIISIISSEKSMEYVLKDTLDFPYKIWQPPQNIN